MGNLPYQKGARKIINRGSKKAIGFFYSVKNNIMIPFESTLERDYYYHIEFDSDILAYYSQPFQVKYSLDNRKMTYTPDVLLKTKYGKEQVIEVKPAQKLAMLDEFKIKEIKKKIEEEGYEYHIITEQFIRIEPQLFNIKSLYRYAQINMPTSLIDVITLYLLKRKDVSISQAVTELNSQGIGLQEIYYLIFKKIIRTNMNKQINEFSIIFH